MKNTQSDVSVDANDQSNQNLPQPQTEQSSECDSNNVETTAQESNNVSVMGEVSSSHDQPVSTTSGVSSSVQYSDSDDDGDDCPVFEYSAESMQVAKDSNDSPESTSKEIEQPAEETMENDEDLVQLDDDDHFGNETGISENQVNQSQSDNNQTIDSPVASPETTTTTNTVTECSEPPLINNECESTEPIPPNLNLENETEDVSETEDQIAESSEAQPSTTDLQETTNTEKNGNSNPGIEGMDTEMISEDEHELHDDVSKEHKADKENNNRKSDRDDSFKKVSKSNKERNYRDKKDKKDKSDNKSRRRRSKSRSDKNSKSRSRSSRRSKSRSSRSSLSKSRSRSRSRNRHRRNNSGKRPRRKDNREKRRDIQRYDVRTLIADRQPRSYKDKYGRDTSRARSISPRRAKSKSRSRSISPGLSYNIYIIFILFKNIVNLIQFFQ